MRRIPKHKLSAIILPSSFKEHPSASYYLVQNWIMVIKWMFFDA